MIFSVALIHVLCQPRPSNWAPRLYSTPSTTEEQSLRLGGSEEIALLLAAGVLIATPCNHAIKNLFKKKKTSLYGDGANPSLRRSSSVENGEDAEQNGGPAVILHEAEVNSDKEPASPTSPTAREAAALAIAAGATGLTVICEQDDGEEEEDDDAEDGEGSKKDDEAGEEEDDEEESKQKLITEGDDEAAVDGDDDDDDDDVSRDGVMLLLEDDDDENENGDGCTGEVEENDEDKEDDAAQYDGGGEEDLGGAGGADGDANQGREVIDMVEEKKVEKVKVKVKKAKAGKVAIAVAVAEGLSDPFSDQGDGGGGNVGNQAQEHGRDEDDVFEPLDEED